MLHCRTIDVNSTAAVDQYTCKASYNLYSNTSFDKKRQPVYVATLPALIAVQLASSV
jgi:hypothetical protein